MGLPRSNNPWSPGEELAFRKFPEANDLAEALDPDHPENLSAVQAMSEIGHLNRPMSWTLGNGRFTKNPLFVIRQEHLEDDVNLFFSILKISFRAVPSRNPKISNRDHHPENQPPPLSEKSQHNLASWYREDLVLMKTLRNQWGPLWRQSSESH